MTTEQLILFLIPMPVLIPAVTAGLALLFSRRPRLQQLLSMAALLLLLILSVWLVYLVQDNGIHTVQVGGWNSPIGITLVADGLSTIMIAVSQLVLFAVHWFGIGQGIRDGDDDDPISVFVPTYMLLNMGVSMAFLAGDLFNMYVGFEVLLLASYVLLTLGASASRIRPCRRPWATRRHGAGASWGGSSGTCRPVSATKRARSGSSRRLGRRADSRVR